MQQAGNTVEGYSSINMLKLINIEVLYLHVKDRNTPIEQSLCNTIQHCVKWRGGVGGLSPFLRFSVDYGSLSAP